MEDKKFKIYVDGGSRGNPGESAIGGAIFRLNDSKPIYTFSKRIGVSTNNEAEYKSVIEALKIIKEKIGKIEEATFFLDSRLIVNQLNGLFKVKKGRFREFIFKIRSLENELGGRIIYKFIPRSKNKLADKLVNLAFLKSEE